jgi:hypothetical protein
LAEVLFFLSPIIIDYIRNATQEISRNEGAKARGETARDTEPFMDCLADAVFRRFSYRQRERLSLLLDSFDQVLDDINFLFLKIGFSALLWSRGKGPRGT